MTTSAPNPDDKPLPPDAHRRATEFRLGAIHSILGSLFEKELHAKQVESLSNALGGVLVAASLAIHAIGRGYALLAAKQSKHGIKQVDGLLGNDKIDLASDIFPLWVKFVLGPRKKVLVVLDWTDFDKDDHTTLSLCLVTRHGRATPLVWKTYKKSDLAGERTSAERRLLAQFDALLNDDVEVTLLADRGFGDDDLYLFLQTLGWDFVIRFRGNILVETSDGQVQPASELVQGGRARKYLSVKVTADKTPLAAVVVVHAKGMKEPWLLATSLAAETPSAIVKLYGRRFCIEETFRDQKDIHFGLGLSATHIKKCDRRDRLLLLGALAQALLTLLGAAGEKIGWDRRLKSNTSKRRQQSLFAQGQFWYAAIGRWASEKVEPLLCAFDQVLADHAISLEMLGEI